MVFVHCPFFASQCCAQNQSQDIWTEKLGVTLIADSSLEWLIKMIQILNRPPQAFFTKKMFTTF